MRLETALRSSATPTVLVDALTGVLVDFNEAFRSRLGLVASDIIGKQAVDIVVWPNHLTRVAVWNQLRQAEAFDRMPISYRDASGAEISSTLSCERLQCEDGSWLLCRLYPLDTEFDSSTSQEQSQLSYRAMFLAAAEGIYRSLPGGGFVDVNPAMARLLGYEHPEDVMRLPPDAAARIYCDSGRRQELLALLKRHGEYSGERSQMRRRDGSAIWVSENCRAVNHASGRVAFLEGSATDITESLAKDAALRQSEALYKVLVDGCRDSVYLIQHGRIRFCNQAMADMFGYPVEELRQIEYMTLVHPDDLQAQALRKQARESGSVESQRYEMRVRHRDGHYVLAEVRADAVMFEGAIASTGLMRDVTNERRDQRALEDAERRYRELFEDSPVGLFKTHIDGRVLEANEVLLAMMGYSGVEQLREQDPQMEELYADPEERKVVLGELARDGVLRGREVRIKTREGEQMLASVSAKLIVRQGNTASEIAGSVIDVTAQRQMAEALRQSELRYRTLVEHGQVGVFISSGERYLFVNEALAAMYGYDEQTLLQKDYRDLLAPEDVQAAEDRLELLRSGAPMPAEFDACHIKADGSRFWVRVSAAPIQYQGQRRITGMMLDVTRRRDAEQRLRFHASHDGLTGLPNRLTFQESLEKILADAHASQRWTYATLFLDLDGFKLINDSLGHAAGDLLLVSLAERMSVELSGEAMVARYGGDEFTILPTGVCDLERATRIAQRVIDLFDAPFEIGDHLAYSSASIGVVLGRPDYHDPIQVLRDADTAMYRAKAAGKSGFVLFDDQMHGEATARFQLETDLRAALRADQFVVHYQPIVSLANQQVVACEALVRWRHPTRGVLLPGEFLAVANETGLIAQIDRWVLSHACQQMVRWQARFPSFAHARLSVNLDDRLMASGQLEETVARVLTESGIAPEQLCLEVTERVFRDDHNEPLAALRQLKALGVRLAVDDFGTGFSSLGSFVNAPFDALKIDRSLVVDMETSSRHRAIVRSVIALADDLGLEVVAEGVENAGQADLLRSIDCPLAQGFLYSKALNEKDFAEFLEAGLGAAAKAAAGAEGSR